MPMLLKLISGILVLWLSAYSVSYILYKVRQKKHKGAFFTLVLILMTVSVFILSCNQSFAP